MYSYKEGPCGYLSREVALSWPPVIVVLVLIPNHHITQKDAGWLQTCEYTFRATKLEIVFLNTHKLAKA